MVTVRPNFQDSVHVGHISGLKKFTEYYGSVLCFTTPGDGPRSPPQRFRTHEDSECPPSGRELHVQLLTSAGRLFIFPRPVRSPRRRGTPQLHRHLGHLTKSQLEGATGEKRSPHR